MAHITTGKQQKYLESLAGSDQVRAFKAFWDSVDTDHLTVESEPLFEYYNRVNYSMQHYNTYKKWKDGWKSDRGMVYILMGPPDYIDHNPHATGSNPYDVWYYYFPKRFYVFIDQNGMGDYRLQNMQDFDPDYSTWKRAGVSKR